jgi:hypothetical protein
MSKRDLVKLGVSRLDGPFPHGQVAEVTVVKYADDDGIERNRIRSFQVVDRVADPTADADFYPSPSA